MTEYQINLLFDMMDDIHQFRDSAKQIENYDLMHHYTNQAVLLYRVFRILNIHEKYFNERVNKV